MSNIITAKRGERFGSLAFRRRATAEEVAAAGITDKRKRVCFLLDCRRCGKKGFVARSEDVRSGNTKSCGCRKGEHFRGKGAETADRQRKDLGGKTCGLFRVIRIATAEEISPRRHRGAYWHCHCKLCGGDFILRADRLTTEPVRCECQRVQDMRRRLTKDDLIGRRIGHLEPLRLATDEEVAASKWAALRTAYWWCKCRLAGPGCVGELALPREALTGRRPVQSCGCLSRMLASQRNKDLARNGRLFRKRLPAIVVGERGARPVVNGKEKRPLTDAQFDIVKALLKAGSLGLSRDQLDKESGRGDALKTLRRLADSDADWAAVIKFPGVKGGGYHMA